MANKKYELGKRTKSVTHAPNWWLTVAGRIDAKRGESVAMAHFRRYLEKCASIENEECLAAEAFLKSARARGAQELATLAKITRSLPTMLDFVEEHHSWDVLENERRQKAREAAQAAIENSRSALYDVNETLLNGASILDERISKIRRKASAKMEAYLKGLRKGGLTAFDPEIEFSDRAAELYYGRHQKLDNAIANAAAETVLEEVI